jgi:hypothetical protein
MAWIGCGSMHAHPGSKSPGALLLQHMQGERKLTMTHPPDGRPRQSKARRPCSPCMAASQPTEAHLHRQAAQRDSVYRRIPGSWQNISGQRSKRPHYTYSTALVRQAPQHQAAGADSLLLSTTPHASALPKLKRKCPKQLVFRMQLLDREYTSAACLTTPRM